jgi:hypothetical protein
VKTKHKVLAVVIVKLTINEYDVSGTQRNNRDCSTDKEALNTACEECRIFGGPLDLMPHNNAVRRSLTFTF